MVPSVRSAMNKKGAETEPTRGGQTWYQTTWWEKPWSLPAPTASPEMQILGPNPRCLSQRLWVGPPGHSDAQLVRTSDFGRRRKLRESVEERTFQAEGLKTQTRKSKAYSRK